MNLFDYIIIRYDFIPNNINKLLLESTLLEPNQSTIFSKENSTLNLKYRESNLHTLPIPIIKDLNNTLLKIHETIIKDRYKSELKLIETPQLLSYNVNGHYDEHNDCEDYVNNILTRVVDRDITIIFYLNDDYIGGELEFTQLGLIYKPKKNSMIVFPSYYEFSHRVHPVQSGTRINLVSWLATKDRIYDRQ